MQLAEGAREEAAGALWSLAVANRANQAPFQRRGIEPLVRLIAIGSRRAQEQAAGALSSIGLNNEANETLIATRLVELLSSDAARRAHQGGARDRRALQAGAVVPERAREGGQHLRAGEAARRARQVAHNRPS